MVNFGFWSRAAPEAGRVTFVAWREILCEYLPENCARDGFGSRPGPKPKIDDPGRGGAVLRSGGFSVFRLWGAGDSIRSSWLT